MWLIAKIMNKQNIFLLNIDEEQRKNYVKNAGRIISKRGHFSLSVSLLICLGSKKRLILFNISIPSDIIIDFEIIYLFQFVHSQALIKLFYNQINEVCVLHWSCISYPKETSKYVIDSFLPCTWFFTDKLQLHKSHRYSYLRLWL